MRHLFIVASIIDLFFSFTCFAQKADLHYTIARKDTSALLITVTFTGNPGGSSVLHLPKEWAGQQTLYGAVSELKTLSVQTAVTPADQPDRYTIRYRPGAAVKFSYVLHKDWAGPLRYPLYFRPVVQRDLFYFDGHSGLVYPDPSDTAQVRCRLTYKGFHNNEFIGNSFYANHTDGWFTVSLNNLLNSVFCAGNFRSKTIRVRGHQVVIAVAGKPAFTDDEAFSGISQIILAERRFWNDAGPNYYLTTFLPLYDQGNTGGTAYYHAFSLFQSADLGLAENLLPIIAHEYFHNWLGLGLKMPEPDEPYKWFSEGFTEYYSYKVLWQTGILSKQDFLARINTYLKAYFLSPYFDLPNQQLIGRYWESSELKLLSYRRGLVLAFLLDNRITEKQHKSLDDLLRLLYAESGPGMTFSEQRFGNLVISYSDRNTLAAINQANAGHNEQLTRLLFTDPVYRMDTLKVNKMFDLGFDYQASKRIGKVQGLEAGSHAAKAGLAEHMPLTDQCSIWFNDTEKPAKIGVVKDGKNQLIEYIPVAVVDRRIPQVMVSSVHR